MLLKQHTFSSKIKTNTNIPLFSHLKQDPQCKHVYTHCSWLHAFDYRLQFQEAPSFPLSWSFPTYNKPQCTYLCGDHDDFQDLDSHFPGNVSSGSVLLTGAHEIIPQVISEVVLFYNVLTDRAVRQHNHHADDSNRSQCCGYTVKTCGSEQMVRGVSLQQPEG